MINFKKFNSVISLTSYFTSDEKCKQAIIVYCSPKSVIVKYIYVDVFILWCYICCPLGKQIIQIIERCTVLNIKLASSIHKLIGYLSLYSLLCKIFSKFLFRFIVILENFHNFASNLLINISKR